ncbi:hypothetical protein [Haloarchaeobius sp. TZWWS8]|uniref:hypothetical protein n=1 Tax=Haloarchaeobius sp. TZWWS8 TaxID=3446121 RepID=UPI003EBEBB5E
MTDDSPIADLNDRYLESLAEQAAMRRDSIARLRESDEESTLDVDAIAAVCRTRSQEFDGHLVFFGASDFGHPEAFVPAAVDGSALKRRVLDGLHEESGKWQGTDEELRAVRDAYFEAAPNLHKGLAVLVTEDGVRYDLEGGVAETNNFVTIRQVAGLVDWLTNSYQAERLTTTY